MTIEFVWDRGRLHLDDEIPAAPGRPCAVAVTLHPQPLRVLVPASG